MCIFQLFKVEKKKRKKKSDTEVSLSKTKEFVSCISFVFFFKESNCTFE